MAKRIYLLICAFLFLLITGCWNFNNPVDPNSPTFNGEETERFKYKISNMYVTASSSEVARNCRFSCRAFIVTNTGDTVDISDAGQWFTSDQSVIRLEGGGDAPGTFYSCGRGSASVGVRFQNTSSDDFDGSLLVKVLDYELIYVSPAGSDDTGEGTMEQPFATINRAVESGETPFRVLIAGGTYTVDGLSGPVSLRQGVSLFGGYNPDTWEQDTGSNETIIQDVNGTGGDMINPSTAVWADGDVSGSRIDSCTILGSAGADYSAAVFCGNGAEPEITGNTIAGGTGVNRSFGIFISNASPFIANNRIDGDGGTGMSTAIYFEANSDPGIYSNTIVGGDGGTESRGIENDNSLGTLVNNLIYIPGGGTQAGIIENAATWTEVGDNYIFAVGSDTGANYDGSGGNISHASAVNPAFVSATDLHLTQNSPPEIIGGARILNISGFPVDSEGSPVDKEGKVRNTAWSRGAYERNSGTYITYSIAAEDGWVQSGGFIDQGQNYIMVGDETANEGVRGFYSFDLTPMLAVPAAAVSAAEFKVCKVSTSGAPSPALGTEIYVDHVLNISYSADLIQSNIFNFPSGQLDNTWQSIPISAQVSDDLSAGRNRSRYRFYFLTQSDMGGDLDYENWAPSEDPNRPELTVDYTVP